MDDKEYFEKWATLNHAFTPSAPISSKDQFKGRGKQVRDVIESLFEPGQHAVIFGERGVGKTSLANIIPTVLSKSQMAVVKVNCNRSDDFKSIWTKALEKLPYIFTENSVGFKPDNKEEIINLSKLIPQKDKITTTDIGILFAKFDLTTLFIFDEFDTISSDRIYSKFADLVKELSDEKSNVKIIFVGIANNVTDLIGEHPSIERCLKQVKLLRMLNDDLIEIVQNGYNSIGITCSEIFQDRIVKLSSGFPHYTHLLSKYIGHASLDKRTLDITEEIFYDGLGRAIENANESIKELYRKATTTSTGKQNKFANILHACALAKTDQFNTFGTVDILNSYNMLTGKAEIQPGIAYNIGKLCQQERGTILEKIDAASYNRYRFQNPLLRAYILMRLYKNGEFNF